MRVHRSRTSTLVALTLLGSLTACGGDSNPAAPTQSTGPAPIATTLVQGTFTGLGPNFYLTVPFNVTSAGEVQVTVDWTLPRNNLDFSIARGGPDPCTDANRRFAAELCSIVAHQSGLDKPERMSLQLAAGQHTLYIFNRGSEAESLSFQVLLR